MRSRIFSSRWIQLTKWPDIEVCLLPVSAKIYAEFVKETNYTPTSDANYGTGYAFDYIRLNFGTASDIPMYGVSRDDADAFARWENCRLPSEDELADFFSTLANAGEGIKWHGLCWTSTDEDAGCVLLDGPYNSSDGIQRSDGSRKVLDREHYAPLELPCFRLIRGRCERR